MVRTLYSVTLSAIIALSPVGIAADKTMPVDTQEEVLVETVVETQLEPTSHEVSLGVFKLSAYCTENYPHICNNGDSSTTATGTRPTAGRTIAVDPKVIPYGSKVIINGHTYTAEDCGGGIKGNRIDIVFNTHQDALSFGIQYAEVFIIEGEQ